jgi:long-chain acyl-CoA synthetase
MSQITDELIELIQYHFKITKPITPESRLESDLGLDSLDKVELLLFIEDKFNITISEYQTKYISKSKLSTVNDVAMIVKVLVANTNVRTRVT